MLKSIKTTESNRAVVADLTRKLNMGSEHIIARIALAYSLSFNRNLDLNNMGDSKGKEYSSKVLFGDYQDVYLAMVCQHYAINEMDFNIPRYIKMHIDDGLELIWGMIKDNPNLPVFDFILDQVERGLINLNEVNGP